MTPVDFQPRTFRNETGLIQVWDLPWPAVRMFDIRGVPQWATRGNHAHRTCDQVIRCSVGQCFLTTQRSDREIQGWDLTPGKAVLVPRMHWIVLSEFSPSAVINVLCSEEYKPPIADFNEFIKEGKNSVSVS